ncbi:MAG: 6-bladed beta-propeller [Candidatus Fermentibacteria bacterium]
MKSSEIVILICLVIAAGCGSGERTGSDGAARSGEDTLASPPDSIITVSDTVSIDLMTDYGIVTVDDIDASGNDRIALLDEVSATVTVITGSGELIAAAGGSGSGPGEFQRPSSISISSTGSVAVPDQMAGTVRIFEPDLDSYSDLQGFMMANPGIMYLNPDGSFAGMRIIFRAEDGNTVIGYQTALWTENDSESAIIYKEDMDLFTPNDFGRSIITPYPMTCSSAGAVFTADVSSEEYRLYSFEPDGTLLWSLEFPFRRILKTELEIAAEEDMVERRMQQSAHQADYTADPFHYAVSSLAIGPMGRLWAERPGAESVFFDVFDTETGQLLFTASVESSLDMERLEVTRGGILGVTTGEIPSLVRLNMRTGI